MKRLVIENVCKKYGQFQVLDHINLTVDPGEFMVIMGPSGCGKTTLLLAILGILKIDEGRIYLGEKQIDLLSVEDRNIGYVPQDFGLFPHMTVYDNIAFGLKVMKQSKSEIDPKVNKLIELVKLEKLEKRKPIELSGGQKQRVALARALAIDPSLLLLDEPLSSIDEVTKADVKKNMKEIIKKMSVTTLCVVHDPEDSFDLGDRIAVTCSGKIIQCGTTRDLLSAPENELVRKLISSPYKKKRLIDS